MEVRITNLGETRGPNQIVEVQHGDYSVHLYVAAGGELRLEVFRDNGEARIFMPRAIEDDPDGYVELVDAN